MDDAQRMNQIMQMDTRALLSTIKDLESKLSQYQRQDQPPPWASSLLPRLDQLEESMRNINIEQSRQATAAGSEGGAPQGREELVRDDRLMSRIKAELHTHAESTALVMEAKVASMNAEMERLHKLLQIRPTTSEYQKVMFIVNDQASQMKHDMQDIQSRLMDIVHNSIAKEIGTILNGIKSNEGLNDRSIDGIIRRVEQVSKDYYELKVSTHGDYEQLTAEQRCHGADIEQLKSSIAASQAKARNDLSHVHSVLDDHAHTADAIRAAQEVMGDELRDLMHKLELSVRNDQNEMTHDLRRVSDRLEFQIKDVKLYADSLQQQLEEHRMQVLVKNNEVAAGMCEINDALASNRTQQNQVLIMLEKLHELDATSRLDALTARLNTTDAGLESLGARAAEMGEAVARQGQHAEQLQASLDQHAERSGRRFDEVYAAMEECQRAIEIGSNDAAMLSDALVDVKASVTGLQALRAEVDYVKQVSSGSIETANALQERVEGLDAMLKYVSETATAAERKAQADLEELSSRLQDSLIESTAEMEARLEQMAEQMAQEVGSRAPASAGRARSSKRSLSGVGTVSMRSEEDSDEASEVSRRHGRRNSNASSGSGRGRPRGRKQSVSYPVEGAPVPAVTPEQGKGRPSIGKVGRQPSSRGVLLGSAGTAGSSRGRAPSSVDRGVPATIIDTGETPPPSRGGAGSALPSPSGSPTRRPPASKGGSGSMLVPSAPPLSLAAPPPGAVAGADSQLQGEFFGGDVTQFQAVGQSQPAGPAGEPDAQAAQAQIHVQVPRGAGEPAPALVSNSSSSNQNGAEQLAPPVQPQQQQQQQQQQPAEPQTHSAGGRREPPPEKPLSTGDVPRRRAAEEDSSLGGSESLNSGAGASRGALVNPRQAAVSAGSVSVQSSSSRQVVSGFAGGAAGGAGYSSGYKYEPNASSVSLQTSSLLRPKSRPDSGYSDDMPFEDRAVHELLDVAERVFELGLHFEEVAVRRSLVPDISEESCSELAALSQTVGETVAKLVDTEALLRILRARPDQPVYGDAFISNRRLRLIDELLLETRKHLENANPEAGITRLDARDYFMKKVERVMQLSLSKHDQVLLPTQTRAGKVKIPSCIACDRPLIQKVRGDLVTRSEVGGRSQIVPFGSMQSQTEMDHFRSLDEGSFYGEQDSLMSKSTDGFNVNGALQSKSLHSLPSSLPRQPSRGGVASLQKANPLDIGARGAKAQDGAYTLLGGFKMPNRKAAVATKYSDDKYLFSGPQLDTSSRHSGEMDLRGSGAAGYLGSPDSKGSGKY